MHLRVPVALVDVVSGELWEAGVLGVEERVAAAGGTLLVASFDAAADAASVAAAVGAAHRDVVVVDVVELGDDSWRDAWRRYARPARAGRRILVVPVGPVGTTGFEPAAVGTLPAVGDDGVEIVLRIDPGRAFGSGGHATTRLALAALEQVVTPGGRVLDVGCGSGVLAVAAARLGAGMVTAVDVAPDAVEATVANAVANGVESSMAVSSTPVAEVAGAFDVVVANIGVRVLVERAADLVSRVAPGGALVLGGILAERFDEVTAAYARFGVADARIDELDGWVGLTWRPPRPTDPADGRR